MRILSGDPGKVNFALAVLDYSEKIDIVGTKMFDNPVQAMHLDVAGASEKFLTELETMWKLYGPFDAMCFERFQSRGLGGNTIEVISLMLGLLTVFALRKKIPISLITASQWKNAFNRTMCLNDLYDVHKLRSKKSPKEIHEFDASLINLYKFYMMSDIVPFAGLDRKIDKYVQRFLASPKLVIKT